MILRENAQPVYPVQEVSKEMDEYQRYLDSKILLDSLAANYTISGDFYTLNNGKGMSISRLFIRDVEKYVRDYESSSHFEAAVNKARRLWELYRQQRQIIIGVPNDSAAPPDQYIYDFGWYTVMY